MAALGLGLCATNVYAATPDTPALETQNSLRNLANAFSKRIGSKLREADGYMSGMSEKEIKMIPYYQALPDGEMLILLPTLSKVTRQNEHAEKLRLNYPITAIKEGRQVYVSLADFVSTAGFSIQVIGSENKAEGWFITEDRIFKLDTENQQITIGTATTSLPDNALLVEGDDIFVESKTLASWFKSQIFVDLQRQSVEIETTENWPLQDKLDRVDRSQGQFSKSEALFPLQEDGYGLVPTAPSANFFLRQGYRKYSDRDAQMTTSYSAQAYGDLGAHATTATVSGNDEDKLSAATVNFSRVSEDADLLGPLKARFYEFNDILPTRVPYAGGAGNELGVRVTNKSPYFTYDTNTRIEGDAPPGWDVELYRNTGQYLRGQTVTDSGRFIFEDVPLFAGENRFDLVLYGPQGEVRRDTRVFSVTPGAFGSGGLYDISLSAQNTQTYQASPVVTAAAPASANLMILPIRAVFKDKDRMQSITVVNTSDKAATFRISFFHQNQTADGGYAPVAAPSDPNLDLAKMLTYSPRQVTLPPGASQAIRLSVRRPAGLPDGEYRTHMHLQRLADDAVPSSDRPKRPGEGISTQLTINIGFSIPIMLRQGKNNATARIISPKIGVSKGQPAAIFTLERQGSYSTLGRAKVFYTPASGGGERQIGILNGLNVFPELSQRTAEVMLTEQPGSGTIRIIYEGDDADKGIVFDETRFQI